MIAYLKGKFIFQEGNQIIIESSGVGYEIYCSQNTLNLLNINYIHELWIYTHLRENSLQLFGFYTNTEKKLFLSLLTVSGIGPKSALNILSADKFENLLEYIENGNIRALSKLPKVGKKTAEQLIISLRGKIATKTKVENISIVEYEKKLVWEKNMISALTNLGFKNVEVEKIIDKIPYPLDFEESIRKGLSLLTKQ